MAIEIERKFLLRGDSWRSTAEGVLYRQGYLCLDPERTVRVRLAGGQGYLTIKGKSSGASRNEYEYPIPATEAGEMLDQLCQGGLVSKLRYRIEFGGWTWEVDEFAGANAGLILAEVELQSEEEMVELPDWIGEEVTGDRRYYNAYLSQYPFQSWETSDS